MATVTFKNIPDELYDKLKAAAKLHHRSINGELINCLEKALMPRSLTPEEWLRRIDELRTTFKGPPMTTEEIEEAINEGRP